jgi:hypothetical protein
VTRDDDPAKVRPVTYPQFAIPLGLAVGLQTSAVLCLGYAWRHRAPEGPLNADTSAIGSTLARTAVVVGAGTLVTVLCLVVGRGYVQSSTRRARVLERLWPALVVLAVIGIVALYRGETHDVFARAADAQVALVPFAITSVARWAWWCSCLAVLAVAVVALLSHLRPGARQPSPLFTSRALAVGVTVAVIAVAAVGVVSTAEDSAVMSRTAERIDAPPVPPAVTGEVAYRVKSSRGQGTNVVAAGSGFVRWTAVYGAPQGSAVEGYDGRTGQRRWVFQAPNVDVSAVAATGTGPDSVAVIQSRGTLIALDATTGAPLWVRHDIALLDVKHPQRAVPTQVVLVARPVPEPPGPTAAGVGAHWQALSPRTGQVLWSRTFPEQCHPTGFSADTVILLRSCQTPPGVAAEVLDPSTGNSRGAINLSALGVRPDEVAAGRGAVQIAAVEGDSALITVHRYGGGDSTTFAVDAATSTLKRVLPPRHNASFIDADSLLVAPAPAERHQPVPLSVVDLTTGAVIPTGSFSSGVDDVELFGLFARVGSAWLTGAPDDPAVVAAMGDGTFSGVPSLRSIDPSGATRTDRSPCASTMLGAARLAVIPGAVLVQCGTDLVGLR